MAGSFYYCRAVSNLLQVPIQKQETTVDQDPLICKLINHQRPLYKVSTTFKFKDGSQYIHEYIILLFTDRKA